MIKLLKSLFKFLTLSFGGDDGGQQQKTDPWEGQQPYLKYLFAEAKKRYNAPSPEYFPGQTLAGQDSRSKEGLDYATKIARGQLQQNAAGSNRAFENLVNAGDIKNNPNLDAAISAATAPAIRAFQDPNGPLSQIRGAFTDTGQFGGTRQGLAEGIAADRLQQNVLGTGQMMAQQAYQSGLDSSARAVALGGNVNAMNMAPATTLDAVGQEARAQQQLVIDDMMNRWNFNQNLPDAKLMQYQNLIQGGFGGITSTKGGVNKTTQGIGMVATGAGIGGAIAAGAAEGSVLGVYGAAIGAGIGLLAALFM